MKELIFLLVLAAILYHGLGLAEQVTELKTELNEADSVVFELKEQNYKLKKRLEDARNKIQPAAHN